MNLDHYYFLYSSVDEIPLSAFALTCLVSTEGQVPKPRGAGSQAFARNSSYHIVY